MASVQNNGKPGAMKKVRGGFQFAVASGQRWADDVRLGNSNERSEIAFSPRFGPRQPFVVSFDMKTDAMVASVNGWLIVGQIYAVMPPGQHRSPPVRQVFEKGVFSVVVQAEADDGTFPQKKIFSDASFDATKWHHLEYRLDPNPEAGSLVVLLDGMQIVDYKGPIGYKNETNFYFKAGVYRRPNALPTEAEFRNIELKPQ